MSTITERVQEALNTIRPALQADGGDIALVDVSDDGVVQVRLVGACSGCPSSQYTLQMGVERAVKERVPEIKQIISV